MIHQSSIRLWGKLIFPMMIFILTSTQFSQSKLYKEVPLDENGPFARVFHEENLPDTNDAKYFPSEFLMSYMNPHHNAVYKVKDEAPQWIKDGVSWKVAEARSWDLKKESPFAEEVSGPSRSLATQTQFYGNALNVSAVDGIVFAESDDMFIYAFNAKTGKLIWRVSPISNNYMGTPLVAGDKVFITAGSVAFTFHQTIVYSKDPYESARGAGVSYNGLISLDKNTGKFNWIFSTKGEVMTTPAYHDGTVFISTGTGRVYAVDAETGEKKWESNLGGMANMSNPVYYEGNVYLSMAVKSYVYSLDSETGKVNWKGEIPGATNTGMGDVTPTVADSIVVMNTVIDPKTVYDSTKGDSISTMNTRVRAFNAVTGEVLWTKDMGRGPKPQSFKGGVALIIDNTVYLGNPVTSKFFALDIKTGEQKWEWKIPHTTPAGAGRGPGSMYKGVLYIAAGSWVYAVNPKDGSLIGSKKVGGYFPILSPTIVGGTMYLGNNYDWVIALPISEVNPNYSSGG